ncbi:MAG: leucine-rich repeat protein [Lachnospiraceae bacterium]|nr:leucine-rich repeat protein [Lachnospiraceae bacterium]
MPDAGYQFIGDTLNISGTSIKTAASDKADEVGRYSFVMPKSAGHISAGFIKTEDVVELDDKNTAISEASMKVDDTVIKNGNAKLDIGSVEVKDEERKSIEAVVADAENEEKYEYVDLTLTESVAKNYDASKTVQDTWETKIAEPDGNVAVSLKLKDTFKGFDSLTVVRVHDGKSEVLKSTYDSATNSLAFSTNKFSTYAIVGKTKTEAPKVEPTTAESAPKVEPTTAESATEGTTAKEDDTETKEKQYPANGEAVGTKLSSGKGAKKIDFVVNAKKQVTVKAVAKSAKTVTIPNTLKYKGVTYKVTEIKANAFKNNKKLKKIVIGKNIKKIGKNAFSGCINLKTITIKTTKLTKKNVGKDAFKNINKKATVTVPKSKLKDYTKILNAVGVNGKKQKIKKCK